MSKKQLNTHDVLGRVERKELTQVNAAELIRVTDRTIRRKLDRLEREDPASLVHGLVGKIGNRHLPESEEKRITDLLKTTYPDFGPELATEKLRELHGIDRDPKTIRRIQIKEGLWDPTSRNAMEIHRSWRLRREAMGELIQFDGSYE